MVKFKTNETTTTRYGEYGEVVTETVSKSWTVNKNSTPFFATYLNSIAWMYEIKSMMAIKVLYKLIERSSFNVGEVSLSVKDRAEICSELDTNTAVISRALRQLLDLNVISGEKGKYKINPEIFWKGDYKTREQLLKANCTITITPNFDFENNPEE